MKSVLITGCSPGFGLETARHYLAQDWQVVATLRAPRVDLLPACSRLQALRLDVTDDQHIRRAVEGAGPIDVLFNAPATYEPTCMETVRARFETRTFGTVALTQGCAASDARAPLERDCECDLQRHDEAATAGVHRSILDGSRQRFHRVVGAQG